MKKLQQQINYTFNNIALLTQALTHKSEHHNNNERLEFLGDSILGAIIAQQLYQQFTSIDEGQLTRIRSSLVRGETLCSIAKELSLGDYLILGKGMLKSGGASQCAVLEDAFEALLGAILLDSDYLTTQKVVLGIYHQRLSVLTTKTIKDPKTQLQEYLQQQQFPLPIYTLVRTSGKDHCAIFEICCTLEQPKISTSQQANSIKNAQQACAKIILEQLV